MPPVISSSSYLIATPVQVSYTIMAKQFQQDVLGDVSKGLTHFYDSGQMWAALIGVAVGYIFKSII